MSEIFLEEYGPAREDFLAAAEAAGFRLLRYRIPHEDSAELFQDYALLRRDPRHWLIHFSGVHGVEGFAGSAIQRQILRTEKFGEEGPSLLFVHGVNAYGMAFHRRANGENVDLNRNYRAGPAAPNPDYASFDSFLTPQSPAGVRFGWALGLAARIRLGAHRSRNAVAGGQASHPKGLFYMGRRVQRELVLLQELLRTHCAEATQGIAIDVHTGLGEFGQEYLFTPEPEGGEWVRSSFGRAADPGLDYEAQAPFSDALKAVFGERIKYLLQEFGARSQLRTLAALRFENFEWHQRPAGAPRPEVVRKAMLDAFFPAEKRWRDAILDLGCQRWREAERILAGSLGKDLPKP